MKYRWRWPLLLVLGVVVLTVPRPPAVEAQQISDGQPGTQATSGGVQILSPTLLAQRPTLTPERQAALAAELERRARLRATRPMGDQVP